MLPVHPRSNYLTSELVVRAALLLVFLVSDVVEPFHRKIQPEELWLYRYPNNTSYVTLRTLLVFITITPLFVFTVVAILQRDWSDILPGGLGLSLTAGITGALTNLIKIAVGRPRPDYLWRCYPDGHFDLDQPCTGIPGLILDGLKSFPSGHSSFAFSVLGFTSFYLAAKLHCFTTYGRGQSWRLCMAALPLAAAVGVAISRTCDYHHHWQDVAVGSLLGLVVAFVCYSQYFQTLGAAPTLCLHCSGQLTPFNRTNFSSDDASALVTVKSV